MNLYNFLEAIQNRKLLKFDKSYTAIIISRENFHR